MIRNVKHGKMWNVKQCFLKYANFKDDLIKYKCCSKSYQRNFYEKLNKIFLNTDKCSYHDNNKVILLLWKGVYPYEYIDGREKFNEVSLPEKEDFYSHLDMEDITDADYAHTKRAFKDFETKNLGEYHDLCVESDTLLLADVVEKYRNMCLEIYELDSAKFLSVARISVASNFKKDWSNIRSFNWYRYVINGRKRY